MARVISAEEQWQRICRPDSDECWPYQGPRNPKGYGLVWRDKKATMAHRWTWEQVRGPIPEGLHVLHDCDNPPCCNPRHLHLGTQVDNNRERDERKRFTVVRGSAQTNAKLTEKQVREIRKRYAAGGISQYALADEYGVSQPTIKDLICRRFWKHVA